MKPYPSLYDRLIANAGVAYCEWADHDLIAGRGDCWQWTGFKVRRGYGRCCRREAGRSYPVSTAAHRCMAEVIGGQLGPDVSIDHACAIPWCIAPLHLRVTTLALNTSDARRRALGRLDRPVLPWLIPDPAAFAGRYPAPLQAPLYQAAA